MLSPNPMVGCRNEPTPSTTTTRLCNQCGHSLKMKLRVRSTDNIETFRTGYVPSSTEHTFISRLIGEAQEDMARYTKELERLRVTAAIISNKQKTLETYIGDLTYIISPIRRIPPEILAEIFTYLCSNGVGTNDLSPAVSLFPTPVTLTLVCFRWKTLVRSMPALWSSFTLRHTDSTSFWLPRFLKASKKRPLDFKVLCKFISADDLALLMENSGRWRSVQLDLPNQRVGKEVFHALSVQKLDLPELVSLRVGLGPDGNDRDSELPVGCAKLRSLTLDGFGLDLLYPRPSIQVLELTNLPAYRIFHLIQNSPNVQQITLRQCAFWEIGGPLPQLALNVQVLEVDYDTSEHIVENEFFENMTMPRLTTLKLLDKSVLPPYDTAPIVSMLQRSSCPLTHLTIGITLTDVDVLCILRYVPAVTHLELGESGKESMVTDDLLRRLTISSSEVEPVSIVPDQDGDIDAMQPATEGNTTPAVVHGSGDSNMAEVDNAEGGNAGDGTAEHDTPDILIPSLVDLSLSVHPTCGDEVLLNFVRSRWKPVTACATSTSSLNDGKLQVACLQRLQLKRATGALFDQLRRKLEEIGKEGLVVSF